MDSLPFEYPHAPALDGNFCHSTPTPTGAADVNELPHATPRDVIDVIKQNRRRDDVSSLFSEPSTRTKKPLLLEISFDLSTIFDRKIMKVYFCRRKMSKVRKSGFKPCEDCDGQMSITDPHRIYIWCLG